jgi:cyclophilin family peptidyl-prolyl cis-trans isomerase
MSACAPFGATQQKRAASGFVCAPTLKYPRAAFLPDMKVEANERTLSTVAVLLGLACSSTPAKDGAALDAGPVPVDTGVLPEPDASSEAGAVLYMPAGYTLTPFLSAIPVRKFAKAEQVLESSKRYVAVLLTDVGRIVLSLYSEETPITCNSFVFLARNHFYDGVAFHRVIQGFMAQTGDPNSVSGKPATWGVGGPGYMFGTEPVPALNFDGAGVVGMARATDPNTNGSQFFITFAKASSLDQQYTVFAKVLEGDTVLPAIVRGEPPAMPTRVTSIAIGEQPR